MDYSSYMGQSFTKLFSSITDSTIWREPDHVRLVWITLLASSDARGRVFASIPGLADKSRVDLQLCIDALDKLMSPDPWSRSKNDEGRRLELIEGGWRLINYSKYRELRDEESVKASKREWWNKNRGSESKLEKPLEKLEPTRPHSNQEEAEEEEKIKKITSPTAQRKKQQEEDEKKFSELVWFPFPERKRDGKLMGRGHKPEAIKRCLAFKKDRECTWEEIASTVERYKAHPNVKQGMVQACEVFFGDRGHALECWEWVKRQQQPSLEMT